VIVPEVVVVPSANSKMVANFSPLKFTMYVLPSSSLTQVPFSLASSLLASSPLGSPLEGGPAASTRLTAAVMPSAFKVGLMLFSFVGAVQGEKIHPGFAGMVAGESEYGSRPLTGQLGLP